MQVSEIYQVPHEYLLCAVVHRIALPEEGSNDFPS
jgi:hypothetical protein